MIRGAEGLTSSSGSTTSRDSSVTPSLWRVWTSGIPFPFDLGSSMYDLGNPARSIFGSLSSGIRKVATP